MSNSETQGERFVGCVKWFNNNAGYGFITVSADQGDRSGTDVFVYHSSINVTNQQYKYLVQGEYVEFAIVPTQGGAHPFQAADVTGIRRGKLMCETRYEIKQDRGKTLEDESSTAEATGPSRPPRARRPPKTASETDVPRVRGEGPRQAARRDPAAASEEINIAPKPAAPRERKRPAARKE